MDGRGTYAIRCRGLPGQKGSVRLTQEDADILRKQLGHGKRVLEHIALTVAASGEESSTPVLRPPEVRPSEDDHQKQDD